MLKRTLASYFSRCCLAALAATLLVLGMSSSAWAQDSGEGSGSSTPAAEDGPVDPDLVRHGVGLRLRYVFAPKGLIELFMEEAAGGMSQPGFGLDYVRRKGNFEFSLGFEYDKLDGTEGYYVESGGAALEPGTTDFVEFDALSWFTVDASFVYHHPLSSLVALRYGGGIGLGIVTGDVIKTDAVCTGPNAQTDCAPSTNPNGELNEKQDFFRFPPVFNLVGGVQFTPIRNLAINVEVGMRTLFYSGISAQYFF